MFALHFLFHIKGRLRVLYASALPPGRRRIFGGFYGIFHVADTMPFDCNHCCRPDVRFCGRILPRAAFLTAMSAKFIIGEMIMFTLSPLWGW